MFGWAIAATLACGAAAIGGGLAVFLVPLHFRRLLLSFAVGILLGTALLHLLPEAAATLPLRPLRELLAATLVAIVACHLFKGLHISAHRQAGPHPSAPGVGLVLAGGALHNMIDAFLIGTAFRVDPKLGMVITLAITAHEVPREMGNFAVLVQAGWSRGRALAWSVACRLPALAAACLGFAALSAAPLALPYIVAATAGVLVYLAVGDLMPAIQAARHADGRLLDAGCVILGALVIAAASHASR